MKNMVKNMPDFSGKCLSISIMRDETSHDLYDPHFEIQGDRLFIVGTIPKGSTSSDWVANCIGAVAWDQVTEYFIFESLEAWNKAIKTSEAYHEKGEQEKN